MFQQTEKSLLPPAYVVRREGNSFTLLVCSQGGGGGYPYPIMLCNISQNAMGQLGGGGVPVSHNALQTFPRMLWGSWGGYPVSHNALQHFPECHGAGGGVPCQVQPEGRTLAGGGGPWPGGSTLAGGGGGTHLGQHREYLLQRRGGYASCVHAGGLSCSGRIFVHGHTM